jgi:hypothetical protein
VVVNLVSGDFNMGATGTVTEVVGNKIYAFGHPFFNLGPIAFPMTQAYIHALLPSMTSSMKISTLGDVIGTVRQDRATTIAGLTGDGPATIPVKIALESDRGFKKQFEFRVVNDQLFTPLFTYASILSTLTSYERETGAATFSIKGTMNVKSHGEVKIEDLFSGNSASMSTAGSIMAPLTFLLDNDFEPIQIEAVDLTIQSTEQPRTATIERVWLDGVRARADSQPAELAASVNASAYTSGNQVVFNSGQYAPNTEGGKRRWVHRLANAKDDRRGVRVDLS